MQVWIVVVALLALAVLFLFISLFLKDNQYEDELDEMSEGLLELNREVYNMKKKIQELEGTPIYRAPVEKAPEPDFSFAQPQAPRFEEPRFEEPPFQAPRYQEPVVEEPTPAPLQDTTAFRFQPELDADDLHSSTRKHILTLFSHGSSYEEIAEQLNVPVSTVQLVIDSYFESDGR